MARRVNRRAFLKNVATAGAGVAILRGSAFGGPKSPNDRLNIAIIGCGGRGRSNTNGVRGENIVALCDVNAKNLGKAAEKFPDARTYVDWRKCVDQKDLDAVVCSTTDHTHAFVSTWAMNRGLSVYCEKPLANSVHEARTVRETYLKNKGKLATQMGTQIHASDNYRRMVEMVRRGAIGTPQRAHVWCSRMPKGGNYLPAAGDPPEHIDWDLWLGPSPEHPYNAGYLGGCLAWNRFWDFGSGQIGDMGSHMMDMAYWALDLRFPTSCKATGSEKSDATLPTWLQAEWEHPANDWRPAVKVTWHDGGKKPGMPMKIFDRDKLFKGVIFRGDKGWLMCDYGWRILRANGDLTYFDKPEDDELIPPSPGHHAEWIEGAKTGSQTLCNFDYSGALIENNLLALVAYRAGKPLEWDAEKLQATNCPEAGQYVTKTYREGWKLNG